MNANFFFQHPLLKVNLLLATGIILTSGCVRNASSKALVGMSASSVIHVNVDPDSKFILVKAQVAFVENPDISAQERAAAYSNAISQISHIAVTATSPTSSSEKPALRGVADLSLQNSDVIVVPIAAEGHQAVTLSSGSPKDSELVHPYDFYVIVPSKGGLYSIKFANASGINAAVPATMDILVTPTSGTLPSARILGVLDYTSLDSLLAPAPVVTGEQKNNLIPLSQTPESHLVGTLSSDVKSFSGGVDTQAKWIPGMDKHVKIHARRHSESSVRSVTTTDSSGQQVDSADLMSAEVDLDAAEILKMVGLRATEGTYIYPQGWNSPKDKFSSKLGASSIIFGMPNVLDGVSGGPGIGKTLKSFKPALAVRASGCMNCHSNVRANLITDFGAGDSYYFGAQGGGGPTYGNIYGDHSTNWSSAMITQVNASGVTERGRVTVPRVSAPSVGYSTLAGYLRAVLTSPGAVGAPEVVEKDSIRIGAPTELELKSAAGVFPASHPKWKYVTASGDQEISGLELSPNGLFVRNTTGELHCSGDVFVNGVLLLNSLKLRTDGNGCRLHSTGTTFIQGPIQYLGSAASRNLQVVSSRAVVLGMDHSYLSARLNHSMSTSFFTRDATGANLTTRAKLDLIINESSTIPELTDASAQGQFLDVNGAVIGSGRNVAFERLLINAPYVHSRYQGDYKGVVIAELAMFALGDLQFLYDRVFDTENLPILPLLEGSTILKVGDTVTTVASPNPSPTPFPGFYSSDD